MTRSHWERVYGTKKPTEVSWYQATAEPSLSLIVKAVPDRSTPIIDVGGGASTLVDGLLSQGYADVTVLDVSGAALEQAAARLGESARRVTWIESDILACALPSGRYGMWHDRAVFHFLTSASERDSYVGKVRTSVRPGGHVMIATFARGGPLKCSGLDVVRYAPGELHQEFGVDFELLGCVDDEHHTPGGAVQPFIYCMCRASGR